MHDHTIDYGCVLALGGPRTDGAGFLLRLREQSGELGPSVAWHPDEGGSDIDPKEGDLVLLPASGLALSRVLGRHLFGEAAAGGWTSWSRDTSDQDHPCYWLEMVGTDMRINVCALPKDPDAHHRHLHVPTLTDTSDPLQDLAEAVVWEARWARWENHKSLRGWEYALLDGDDNDEWGLSRREDGAELTPWTVEDLS